MAEPAGGQQPEQAWAQVVARAWADEAFKVRLLADPPAVLREAGLAVPAGVDVRVHEVTERLVHLVLPPKGELTEAQLGAALPIYVAGIGFQTAAIFKFRQKK